MWEDDPAFSWYRFQYWAADVSLRGDPRLCLHRAGPGLLICSLKELGSGAVSPSRLTDVVSGPCLSPVTPTNLPEADTAQLRAIELRTLTHLGQDEVCPHMNSFRVSFPL